MNPYKYGVFTCLLYIAYDRFLPQIFWVEEQPVSADHFGSDIVVDEVLPTETLEEMSFRKLGSSPSSSGNLTNTSTLGTSSSAGHGSAKHNSHPHEALFFMFNALVIGTAIMQLTTLPMFHSLQFTVCMFILGVVYSLIQEGFQFKDHIGPNGHSYDMWMRIDPHLLLFTMLPALLAGDAMTIDTSVARTVSKQCIFLAGPGVLFGSFMTALFLKAYLPYDWPDMLYLVCGSILAATDPVAVVGLLKELGASPTLTVQIQGESLLNDGTAIVLYSIAYDILKGEEYDAAQIVIFLIQVAGCALILGFVIGWFFLSWIRVACNRHDHHSGLIQTALTLCCAYWSFCIAEGALHISGVLCTVVASLVLADKMWPAIVDKGSLHHIWHMFEYLGNTVIFFLAGALVGQCMLKIPFQDYCHLLVIYVVATLIRGALLFGARPLLTQLSADQEPVSLEDAAVMTWGGLRGAVGLALAIQVAIDKAGGKIKQLDADRVLFYVGGIAALTLCVNAVTCPMLVRKLGVTKTPEAKQRMLFKLHRQLPGIIDKEHLREEVAHAIEEVLEDAKHHIDHLLPHKKGDEAKHDGHEEPSKPTTYIDAKKKKRLRPVDDIIETLEHTKRLYDQIEKATIRTLDVPELPFASKEDELKELLQNTPCDPGIVKATNEAFLSLVSCQYWQQVDNGEFVSGTKDAETLLTSVSRAFKQSDHLISDLKYILYKIQASHEANGAQSEQLEAFIINSELDNTSARSSFWSRRSTTSRVNLLDDNLSRKSRISLMSNATNSSISKLRSLPAYLQAQKLKKNQGPLQRFLESLHFNIPMSTVLVLNSIFILVEQRHRKGDNYGHGAWITIEIIFTVVFFLEFAIKIVALRPLKYFLDAWNDFDFALLLLSIVGIAIEFASEGKQNAETATEEARIFRLNRVFRVLRILRVFRLVKFFQIMRARLRNENLSLQLAEHLKAIVLTRSYIRAHVASQEQLVTFFGDDGQIKTPEQARVVLESQTQIYRAIAVSAQEAEDVDAKTLLAMKLLRENMKVTGEISDFIHHALHVGVINGREAETFTHPLEDHCRIFAMQMKRAMAGRTSRKVSNGDVEHGGDSTYSLFSKHSFSGIAHKAHEEHTAEMQEEEALPKPLQERVGTPSQERVGTPLQETDATRPASAESGETPVTLVSDKEDAASCPHIVEDRGVA